MNGIEKMLNDKGILYTGRWHKFGNNWAELDLYSKWLANQPIKIREFADEVSWYSHQQAPCLLCSEGDPFEKDGVTPRCHRVYVADALVSVLGDGWTTVHL